MAFQIFERDMYFSGVFRVFYLFITLFPTLDFAQTVVVSPHELLQASNFQVVAPYIYGNFCKKNIQSDWGYGLYTEYLKARYKQETDFDDLKEEEITSCIRQFNVVLDQVGSSSGDTFYSDVIIDDNKTILNGCEQVAACLLNDKKIMCEVQQGGIEKKDISHDLKQVGFAQKYLDAMAGEYIKLNPKTKIALVWPPGIPWTNTIKQMLADEVTIVYEKQFELKNNGPLTFMLHIPDKIPFIKQVFHQYFSPESQGPFKFVVLVFETEKTLEEVTALKTKIRDVVPGRWKALHTYDTHEQTIEATHMMLNDNSIHFMNHAAKKEEFSIFYNLLCEYEQGLPSHLSGADNFCIDSDGVLAVYGISDIKNLSFVQFEPEELCFTGQNISNNNKMYSQLFDINKDELIFNPENFFYYHNLKFAAIDWIIKLKKERYNLLHHEKDVIDLKLIEEHLNATGDEGRVL